MTKSSRILSLLCYTLFSLCNDSFSQESTTVYDNIINSPDKFLKQVDEKTSAISNRLIKQSGKYLQRLSREEARLKIKLAKKDSSAAAKIFGDDATQYRNLQKGFTNNSQRVDKFRNRYIPHLDTLQTAFRFLQESQTVSGNASPISGNVKDILDKMEGLQQEFNYAEQIKKYLHERKDFLQSQLAQFGLTKDLKKFTKEVYYYREQVEQYKAMFDDPSKLEAKVIQLLSKTSVFQNFFANNSQLAGMFQLPGSSSHNSQTGNLAKGLQGRKAIQEEIIQRLGSNVNVNQLVQQKVQPQMSSNILKNKIRERSGGKIENRHINRDMDLPAFKPNNQKVKSFKDRLDIGTNLQTVKSNRYFPTTTNIGLSLGYKLNDNSIVGIGTSYNVGWGKDIRRISISHEGVALRSFLDYKLKGSFFLAGGFEQNYRSTFNRVEELKNKSAWQSSGLIGLSKKFSLSNKVAGNMQLLWDFLSYQQLPRTQAVLFRVGYSLK